MISGLTIQKLKYLLFILLVLFGIQACTQKTDSSNQSKDHHATDQQRQADEGDTTKAITHNRLQNKPDTANLPPSEHGTFKNYAFVVNSKVIPQQALADYPKAKLDKIFPYSIKLEGNEYRGAVYFHTPKHPAPPVPYADDPAYFINGTQVSPYDIRSSRPEAYSKITKSIRDTLIDGTPYKGSIYVVTDEDFFAERTPLPDLLKKRTGLPLQKVIVNWCGPTKPIYIDGDDVGTVISNNFSIYHIDISKFGLLDVKVDTLRFAEGERYVVHLLVNGYKWGASVNKWRSPEKAQVIFEHPLAVDTDCPCYLTNFDTRGVDKQARHNVELSPVPYPNEAVYLKKLSTTIGLPGKGSKASMTPDSIVVRFTMTKDGMLAGLESIGPEKPEHRDILTAIKRHSCRWSIGIISGFRHQTNRKLTIFYSKDQKGNVQSLDTLAYRYDI